MGKLRVFDGTQWHDVVYGGVEYTDEQVRDVVAATLVGGTNVTITPDDTANTITIDATSGSSVHDHDDRYYTEGEMNFLLDQKAAVTHNHAANEVTSGTFSISRIPTGTTSSTVSLGNHNHDSSYLKLTGGSLSGPLDVNAEVRDNRLRSLVFVFNNGGIPLQAGMQVDLYMPYSGWLVSSHAIMNTSDTVGVSLWRRPAPNVPTSSYSYGSISLSGPFHQQSIGWASTDVNAGDILRANIDSHSGTITQLSWNITVRLR